ncbi:hypothetical protein [Polaribacter sp. Q13]|uniref:hypothetical protein n=1 Tax=Polaribacter sp. Q13 TaxID=2806551 RepID=UPI00193C60A9|nr:hypothetical protein [Polaribacter sp. Q13]QVY64617.1 hypothetical protein JOP69_12670 [Polaribacter sp. Q13]
MRTKCENKTIENKLSLEKFQISKISNPQFILGGGDDDPIKTTPTIIDDANN